MIIKRRQIGVAVSVFVASAFLAVMTQSPSGAAANTSGISQGFHTNETNLVMGALMSLDPNDKGSAILANTDRVTNLVGVVEDKSLLALSNNTPEVQIAIGGAASRAFQTRLPFSGSMTSIVVAIPDFACIARSGIVSSGRS